MNSRKGTGIVQQRTKRQWRHIAGAALMMATCLTCGATWAKGGETSINAEVGGLFIPASRSELVVVPQDIAQILVADPAIADVHVIGAKRIAFIGKNI